MTPVRRWLIALLTPGARPNRMLLLGLTVVAGVGTLLYAAALLLVFPQGVDLEIPLRAAQRWAVGQPPYLPAPPGVRVGPQLPFLYPPFVLPLVSPLLSLPRMPLLVGWSAACFLVAVYSCRRLGIPVPAAIAAMLWPPFLEGILGGNVQIPVFAAFVTAFWRWPERPDWTPRTKGEAELRAASVTDGSLAAAVGLLKVTQFHAWLLVLRSRPRAAVGAALLCAVLIGATLALTGTRVYGDWLAQLSAASDPRLGILGDPLAYGFPQWVSIALLALTAVLVLWIPLNEAPLWLGILLVLGSPSLQTFGWLFLLPSLVVIRGEVGLICALLLATNVGPLRWLALAVTTAALLLAPRWPSLRRVPEPAAPANRL